MACTQGPCHATTAPSLCCLAVLSWSLPILQHLWQQAAAAPAAAAAAAAAAVAAAADAAAIRQQSLAPQSTVAGVQQRSSSHSPRPMPQPAAVDPTATAWPAVLAQSSTEDGAFVCVVAAPPVNGPTHLRTLHGPFRVSGLR
eukprot:357392-Chlamydomonas_euryale.AAC.24